MVWAAAASHEGRYCELRGGTGDLRQSRVDDLHEKSGEKLGERRDADRNGNHDGYFAKCWLADRCSQSHANDGKHAGSSSYPDCPHGAADLDANSGPHARANSHSSSHYSGSSSNDDRSSDDSAHYSPYSSGQ